MGKIMIIVPHEDDEILMAAGIIEQALFEGKQVTVVVATNGDYEGCDKLTGSVRLSETIEGLKVLGLPEDRIIFMGYADTGMNPADSFLYRLFLEKDEEKIYPGHCSRETYGLEGKPDFHRARYGVPASYTRKNFREDLKEIIRQIGPDTVYTTSKEDMHGDHSGLFLFVKEVLSELYTTKDRPVLYSGVVHSKAGDENWPLRDTGVREGFTCPEGFNEGSLKWEERISFSVPESMRSSDLTLNKKALALSKHKNALKEDAVDYLYSFIKGEELFWKIID
ncbi:MAG: PIG-L deacetylase family protein [Lachnospiraceae bacterium]